MTSPFTILCLTALCLLLPVVSAAGHSRVTRPTPLPSHIPSSFPTADQLAQDDALADLYTGDNMINVHVVPHTHDDVGWLKTVDQYYMGR